MNLALVCSCVLALATLTLPGRSAAQSDTRPNYTGGEIQADATRDLNVLVETLSPQEIDRAVLNRLLREISEGVANTTARLGLSEQQAQEIFIILSNARGFINGSEMQNVRAMCEAWDESTLPGEARINAALDAYRAREQLTKNFIAKYYSVVLFDIEALLDAQALSRFRSYMDDRRGRMANAGATSFAAPVQNIRAGTATIDFHCR